MTRNGKDIISRIYQRWMKALFEEMQGWAKNLSQEAMDPAKFMEFMKQMGVDLSSLAGMVGSKSSVDHYQILGLDKSASDEEIKKRYRDLLYKLHPDTAGIKGTSFLLQMIMAAYEVIKRERGLS